MEFGYCPNCIAIQLLHCRQLGRLGRTGVGAGRAGQAGAGRRASGSWALGERAQGAGACHAQARCRRTDARQGRAAGAHGASGMSGRRAGARTASAQARERLHDRGAAATRRQCVRPCTAWAWPGALAGPIGGSCSQFGF